MCVCIYIWKCLDCYPVSSFNRIKTLCNLQLKHFTYTHTLGLDSSITLFYLSKQKPKIKQLFEPFIFTRLLFVFSFGWLFCYGGYRVKRKLFIFRLHYFFVTWLAVKGQPKKKNKNRFVEQWVTAEATAKKRRYTIGSIHCLITPSMSWCAEVMMMMCLKVPDLFANLFISNAIEKAHEKKSFKRSSILLKSKFDNMRWKR